MGPASPRPQSGQLAGREEAPAIANGEKLSDKSSAMKVAASARLEFLAKVEANTPTAAANQAEPRAMPAARIAPSGWIAPRAMPTAHAISMASPIRRALHTAPNCLARITSPGVSSVVARLIQVSCSRSPVIATADEAATASSPREPIAAVAARRAPLSSAQCPSPR